MLVKEKHDWHQIGHFFFFLISYTTIKSVCNIFQNKNKNGRKEKKAQVDPTTDQDVKSNVTFTNLCFIFNSLICQLLVTRQVFSSPIQLAPLSKHLTGTVMWNTSGNNSDYALKPQCCVLFNICCSLTAMYSTVWHEKHTLRPSTRV